MEYTNYHDVVKDHVLKIPTDTWKPSLFISPEIPEKKLNNAINKYAKNVDKERVIALLDTTLFGSATEGFIITDAALYFKDSFTDLIIIKFSELDSAKYKKEKDKELTIVKHGEITSTIENSYFDHIYLKKLFDATIEATKAGLTKKSDGCVIVQDMNDKVKVNYLKVIVNMTYEDDNKIDQKELAEIQTLMTQLNFSPEIRHVVRSYICNPNEKMIDILEQIDKNIPSGSEKALHVSLVKDLIRIHRATKITEKASKSTFINKISKKYEINDDQIHFIEEVCVKDELIISGKISDETIIKNSKELATKAAAVGIPITAVYLSGSVVGLSAAGITSGLGALGLGGVLGLSSMVTGIGAVVLLGVGVYKGVQWLTSSGEREKGSKREFMIQEVIRLNQKTISNLADDVNFFAKKIIDLVRESEINHLMINKLNSELTIFSNAIDVLRSRGVMLEGNSNESE